MTKSLKIANTLLILIAVYLLPSFSQAEELSLDIKIESVSSQGQWEAGNKEGSYRFVLYQYGFEHVRGEIWVQWLTWEVDKDGIYTRKVLAADKPIEELNRLGFALEQPVCVKPWPCKEFNIVAASTFEGVSSKKYLFKPTGIGTYEIKEVEL